MPLLQAHSWGCGRSASDREAEWLAVRCCEGVRSDNVSSLACHFQLQAKPFGCETCRKRFASADALAVKELCVLLAAIAACDACVAGSFLGVRQIRFRLGGGMVGGAVLRGFSF